MFKKCLGLVVLTIAMIVVTITYSEQSNSEPGGPPSQGQLVCTFHGQFIGVAYSQEGCLDHVTESMKEHDNPLDCISTDPLY